MRWRLHLSTQPVAAVQLIPSDKPLVAVWDSRHTVHYYTQADATPSGEQPFDRAPLPDDLAADFWQEFTASLQAPNGQYLPTIFMSGLSIYQSRDGRLRLYHFHDGDLVLEVEGRHITLDRDGDGRFLAVGLDRSLGLCAALSERGGLHIFQQHIRITRVALDLTLGMEARLSLAMPDGLGWLLISDGRRVMTVDSAGRILHQFEAHFAVGTLAVSPNGQYIALGDVDDNLIRVYDSTLRPTHQKHAIDLIASARQVQLIASLPGRKVGISAVDISDKGVIGFALGGVVCVVDLKALDVLPQPRPLL